MWREQKSILSRSEEMGRCYSRLGVIQPLSITNFELNSEKFLGAYEMQYYSSLMLWPSWNQFLQMNFFAKKRQTCITLKAILLSLLFRKNNSYSLHQLTFSYKGNSELYIFFKIHTFLSVARIGIGILQISLLSAQDVEDEHRAEWIFLRPPCSHHVLTRGETCSKSSATMT